MADGKMYSIDILYMHWWGWDMSLEEVTNGLHNLVVQGKVLYPVRFSFSSSEHQYCTISFNSARVVTPDPKY
jgi:aryl-alcohol dehydrogenase-like predicted oxidoreductase